MRTPSTAPRRKPAPPSRRRRTPFESPAEKLFALRPLLRLLRNCGLVVAAVTLLVEVAGEPFLRWEYRYRGRYPEQVITDATYVGFSRRFEARAGAYAEGCPVVLLVRPEEPLWRRAAGGLAWLVP